MAPSSRSQHLLAFLLFLASPVHLQRPPACELIRSNVARGSYLLEVTPRDYKPGAIYTVTVSGIENGTSLILQAVSSSDEESSGLWEVENQSIACSDTESVVQRNVSGSGTRTRWTSPSNANVASAQIRAFVSFANGTTLLQTRNLLEGGSSMAVTPSASSQPTSGSPRPTLSNTTDHHLLHNTTVVHHNLASSHQLTKGPPHSGASAGPACSFLLALLQVFSISLGYKLLA
nr:PREDICTED: uncharacterized protein LOC103280313 [Anolis carolinensis]|eukprot:XP_008117094.1 PREDICTED: uncharacterized protein LOC103280313 [Anolis carolinensis]